jgi:transposase
MFPRIKKCKRKSQVYEYLVLSQSFRTPSGQSTTKDIANLGNVSAYDKQTVQNLIDGLIRLFEIEKYGLAEQVEILESFEYGSIILWRALWNRMGLSKVIHDSIHRKENRITIEVSKYVEMMVINRCMNPLSKLGASRWRKTTCYAVMKEYAELPGEVEYFYRSMDYLLKEKDAIEKAVFQKLRNLFSINVRLTFYDITSTFFYTDSCPLAFHGMSRDKRPDKKQIVIGVVTSYEGYPLKHYVFEGNTKDETTVGEVVQSLKREFNIEETTFVGDRGMITRLNLQRIEDEQFDYIMGVKHRQNEMAPMVLEDPQLFKTNVTEQKGLKITERRFSIKDFLIWKTAKLLQLLVLPKDNKAWQKFETFIRNMNPEQDLNTQHARQMLKDLKGKNNSEFTKVISLLKKYHQRCQETIRFVCALNEERALISQQKRSEKISSLTEKLDKLFDPSPLDQLEVKLAKLFEGHNRRYRRFFSFERHDKNGEIYGYHPDETALATERNYDGVFLLVTTRDEFPPDKVVQCYKNLQEVELLFDDLKHFVDIHPVRHRLEDRVRAHVFLCLLALLLKRIFEIDCLGNTCVTEPLETVAKSKLVTYKVKMSDKSSATRTFRKVTTISPQQQHYFNLVGVKNPAIEADYSWWET